MKTNNNNVIKSWLNGRAAESHNGNLSTNGWDLWSYSLKIGTRLGDEHVVFDYTSPAGYMRSVTTSQHVNKAKYLAGRKRSGVVVMNPKAAKAANLIHRH